MEEILLRKLIEKNYFKVTTEVDARAHGKGLDGLATHRFEQTYTVTGLFESQPRREDRHGADERRRWQQRQGACRCDHDD
jgi:hypothetical protein